MKNAKSVLALGLVGIAVMLSHCTDSKFTGSGKSTHPPPENNPADGDGDSDAGEGGTGDDATAVSYPENPFFAQSETYASENSLPYAWIVTSTGDVTRIDLSKSEYPVQNWQFTGSGGHRTYVSEIGLLIGETRSGAGNTSAKIYRASEKIPNTVELLINLDQAAQGSRVCVTSFLIDGVPHLGAAYNHTNGKRAFLRVPIDKAKNSLVMPELKEFYLGASGEAWGYSCYIDQSRGYFWSAYVSQPVYGVNVKTGADLPFSDVPNGPTVMSDNSNTAYAISGDDSGHLLKDAAAVKAYTYAYDPGSKMVFQTMKDSNQINLVKPECFTTKINCQAGQDIFSFTVSEGPFQPLSSLNDGRVIAINRNKSSNPPLSKVYLLQLKDPTKPAEGLLVTLIKGITGDAYMYTDFTGATLYAPAVEYTFDPGAKEGFRKDKKYLVKLQWHGKIANQAQWQGLNLEVKCFSKGASEPEFKAVKAIPVAGENFVTALPECTDATFDMVKIRITQASGGGEFTRLKSVEVKVFQSK